MENVTNTGLGVIIGGVAMWLVQFIAGKFIDKKYTLEKERFDKLMETVNRLDVTLNRIDADNARVSEKLLHVASEIADVKEDIRELRDKINHCELEIAKK